MAKSAPSIPFEFVMDELEGLEVRTRQMFGCLAIYVADQIVFVQRLKDEPAQDNGLWLATSHEHHESLSKIFPNMRSISIFGPRPSGWQNLPYEAEDFEDSVLRACKLVRNRDPRIGKVPKEKKSKKAGARAKRSGVKKAAPKAKAPKPRSLKKQSKR